MGVKRVEEEEEEEEANGHGKTKELLYNIVTCRVVHATNKTGSS
jgi:hypothetical protein